jgi:hypothetical protein
VLFVEHGDRSLQTIGCLEHFTSPPGAKWLRRAVDDLGERAFVFDERRDLCCYAIMCTLQTESWLDSILRDMSPDGRTQIK